MLRPGFQIIILLITITLRNVYSEELERVTDDDLLDILRHEKYVVVLFTKRDCEECDQLENMLLNLKEDFKENLQALVIKIEKSHLTKTYSPSKEPAIVFFRHGLPLLYEGALDEDLILQTFNDNREPIVKELSDNNFEHLTQASTGATTGDWLIMFYTDNCVDCQRLSALFEGVGANLKRRLNVARINKDKSRDTAVRFNIENVPQIILLRQGKYYLYELPKYDFKSLETFAKDWYKNSKATVVPKEASPFDKLTDAIVKYLNNLPALGIEIIFDHPYVAIFITVGFLFTFLITVLTIFKTSKQNMKKNS